mgnify:CR=1 FL=1
MKYLFFLLTLSFFACNSGKTEDGLDINFNVSGKIEGAGNENVYVEAISADGTIDVAKGVLDDDGSFEIEGNIPGMGIYQLRLGDGEDKIIPLTMMPDDKVKINSTIDDFVKKPVLTGTEWATPLTKYMAMYSEFADQQRGLGELEAQGASEEELMKRYFELRKPLDRYAVSQMKKNPGNPVNIILSSALSPNAGFPAWDPKNLEILKSVSQAFNKRFSGSPLAANMDSQVALIENGYLEYLANGSVESTDASSEMAPQISMKNPDGKIINLSDLKGKFVLIDFWASWCGPCRKENPNVVRMYNEYKDKDFTVFSVSLDDNPQAWKAAIVKDGLVWPNHVSDLLKWDTPLLSLYGFNSIPHTVLIDKTGKVIAKNLRGASLEQKLKEIL